MELKAITYTKLWVTIGFALTYLTVGIACLQGFVNPSYNFYLGLMVLPFVIKIADRQNSFRYFIPAVIFCFLAIIISSKTLLFLSILFMLILLIESTIGKLNHLFLFLILLISPISTYISTTIGFPIRLGLSNLSAKILSLNGEAYTSTGNIISYSDRTFSIDQACAGLNMLITSLIICVFLIAHMQKKLNKNTSSVKALLLLFITFVLNIIANLFRIIILVKWEIMPDNSFHYLIGLLCLIVYVIIPMIFIVKYMVRLGLSREIKPTIIQTKSFRYIYAQVFLLIMLFFGGYKSTQKTNITAKVKGLKIEGFSREIVQNSILKFQNQSFLIYIKPTPFYSPEHNPMVCWQGSGYEFTHIKVETIKDKTIYTGLLSKGKDKIYTAWWFDDGKLKTINQFEWRWKALTRNQKFNLINVNATSTESLNHIIIEMLNTSKFST